MEGLLSTGPTPLVYFLFLSEAYFIIKSFLSQAGQKSTHVLIKYKATSYLPPGKVLDE